jgi:hypothetical protein
MVPDHPLLSQAAALLCTVITHLLPPSCSLEQLETLLHQLSQETARRAAEQFVSTQAAATERQSPLCSRGAPMVSEQKRQRAVLLLFGLVRFEVRRYRRGACGAWRCPAAERLGLAPRQRMTRTLQEIVTHFGLSWSYGAAAVLLGRVLPLAKVSARTVERVTRRSAQLREAKENAGAEVALDPAAGSGASDEEWEDALEPLGSERRRPPTRARAQ